MQRKATLMRFLVFGLTSFILMGCDIRDKHGFTAEFIFINETSHELNYSYIHYYNAYNTDTVSLFQSSQGDTTRFGKLANGNKNENIETCCQGILDGINLTYPIQVSFDDSLCLIYQEGEGPTSITNYEGLELKNDYFQFTYRFTEQHYNEAVPCN